MSRAPGNSFAVAALCLIALCADLCAADTPLLVFDLPTTVAVRQSNGAVARGKLLSVSERELLLRTANGSAVTFQLDRIRSVRTTDNTFEYFPGKESFEQLCERAEEMSNVTLTTSATARTAAAKSGLTSLARPADAPSAAAQEDAAAESGRSRLEADKRQRPIPEPAAEQGPPVADEQAEPPAPGSTIYSCSNCTRDLPANIRSGDACPHCGEIIVFEEDSAESAAQTPPRADPFAASGPPTVPIADPPVAQAVQTTAGGWTASGMPLIAKIGIFLVFLVVGWLILQRR